MCSFTSLCCELFSLRDRLSVAKALGLRKTVLLVIIAIVVLFPIAGPALTSAKEQPKALILSSFERFSPMAHVNTITSLLMRAGYNVTFLSDTSVTVNLLTTQLNDYDVVIWRTEVYARGAVTYWYVGELANHATLQAYAPDAATGRVDGSNGILGVDLAFFHYHFNPGSLANVKLAILMSSMSLSIAKIFVDAGVKSTVDYFASFSNAFSLTDYVTQTVVENLAAGNTVKDSVVNTVNTFISILLADSLDPSYMPPVSYFGDGAVTIT